MSPTAARARSLNKIPLIDHIKKNASRGRIRKSTRGNSLLTCVGALSEAQSDFFTPGRCERVSVLLIKNWTRVRTYVCARVRVCMYVCVCRERARARCCSRAAESARYGDDRSH